MGGSVGIGALIVGVALIGVFVIANSAINAQMESSLEAIQSADDPLPSISFVNENLDEDAILDFDIDDAGAGYAGGGQIICNSGCGTGTGFIATYDTNLGALTGFTIVSHGLGYTGAPVLEVIGDPGTITTTATFNNLDIGNALFANLTNDGSVAIEVDDMWISVDGDEPEDLSSSGEIQPPMVFATFFPSEVISITFLQGGASGSVTSLSVTAMGAVDSVRV